MQKEGFFHHGKFLKSYWLKKNFFFLLTMTTRILTTEPPRSPKILLFWTLEQQVLFRNIIFPNFSVFRDFLAPHCLFPLSWFWRVSHKIQLEKGAQHTFAFVFQNILLHYSSSSLISSTPPSSSLSSPAFSSSSSEVVAEALAFFASEGTSPDEVSKLLQGRLAGECCCRCKWHFNLSTLKKNNNYK